METSRELCLESTERISWKLVKISDFIVAEAQMWVDHALKDWQHFDKVFLKAVFKGTLTADPLRRVDNVSYLPLVHGNRYDLVILFL